MFIAKFKFKKCCVSIKGAWPVADCKMIAVARWYGVTLFRWEVILTCIVAKTLHISNRAKATANTAPITLRITNNAFISDGQSERRKKKIKQFSYKPANASVG